jgi:hypothetical protein
LSPPFLSIYLSLWSFYFILFIYCRGRAVSWRRVRTDNVAATDSLLRGRQGLVAAAVPRPGGDHSVIILLFGGFSFDSGGGHHHHDPSPAIIAFDPRTSPASSPPSHELS